ncbi:MAG: ADP-ribose diphosphatase [Rhodospirillales bacterium]|nr:ADP-ribose diphosphatase [Rhodospirillales bacterium]
MTSYSRADIEIIEQKTVFQGYFRIDRYRLRHKLFAGGWSGEVMREIFERGHAAAVLPYDPVRDTVALVEQFRIGALSAGRDPWMIEVVAGIIDAGETPEEVVRREAIEESGVTLTALAPMLTFLASPGGTSETCALYCGRADLSQAGGIHGLPEEHEDIRVLVLPADEALALLAHGKVENATAVIALQWLALNRDRLRLDWR